MRAADDIHSEPVVRAVADAPGYRAQRCRPADHAGTLSHDVSDACDLEGIPGEAADKT